MKKVFSRLKLFKELPIINLFFIAIMIPFLRLIIKFNYDNDFWFTINQGRYVLEHGFPIKAINVIHNLDFLYQSWGSGVLFYLVYNYLGNYGIIALLIIVMELTSFFFYKLCYVISEDKRKSLIVTIIVMILYNFYFSVTRPHIFTILNLVIMFYLFESYFKTFEKKYLYFLPVLSLLEINMHGIYFIVLLVIMFPYLLSTFKFKIGNIVSAGCRKREIFITYFFMLLTGLINPYGINTIIYGFSSYSSSSLMNNVIVELLAPNFHKSFGKVIIITILLLYIIYFKSDKKIHFRYYLFLIGTSYLALDGVKSFSLFIVSSGFPLAFMLKNTYKEKKYSKFYCLFHSALACIIIITLCININVNDDINIKKYADYLDNVADKEKTKLYTNFFDGSYMEWRGYLCYIDPRAEVFLKSNNHQEDILKEYFELQYLDFNYQEFLDKYEFDYLLLNKKDDTLYKLLLVKNEKYNIILEDESYALYQRIVENY